MTKRQYRNTAQAEVAALTRQRILQATLTLFAEQWIDAVTLDLVAERAGVTVQTILRHFGSKEGLAGQAGLAANQTATDQRAEAPIGDLAGAVDNLVQHYEEAGDRVIRLLAQEDRYSQLHELLKQGRFVHQQWVGRVFAPYLDRRLPDQRERLAASLIVACDVYVWRLLRRDMCYSVEQYQATLLDMIVALTNSKELEQTEP